MKSLSSMQKATLTNIGIDQWSLRSGSANECDSFDVEPESPVSKSAEPSAIATDIIQPRVTMNAVFVEVPQQYAPLVSDVLNAWGKSELPVVFSSSATDSPECQYEWKIGDEVALQDNILYTPQPELMEPHHKRALWQALTQ